MRRQNTIACVAAAAMLCLAAAPASAGVDWFGISVGVGPVSFSFGYSDYSVYDDGWYDPSWSLDFDVALAGYGDWVWVDGLGRVWRPYVAGDWRPYSYGRWVYTGLGWTWVSYEPWGYVPHHYGSWAMTTHGWVWLPGYTYQPANVVWVHRGSYVGWYPCAPRGWSHSHRGFWQGYDRGYGRGYDDGWRDAGYATWVDWNHMGSDNVARYAQPPSAVERRAAASRFEVMNAPPSRSEVQRLTGQRVREVAVAQRVVRMGGNQVTVVRPEGVAGDIQRHARDTVRQGLSSEVDQRLERHEPVQIERGSSDRLSSSRTSVNLAGSSSDRSQSLQPSSSRSTAGRTAVTVDRTPVSIDRSPSQQQPRSTGSPSSRGALGTGPRQAPSIERTPPTREVGSGSLQRRTVPMTQRSNAGSATVRQAPSAAASSRTVSPAPSRTLSASPAPAVRQPRVSSGRSAQPAPQQVERQQTTSSARQEKSSNQQQRPQPRPRS